MTSKKLKEIDALVEKYVELYQTDWYIHDRPRAEKDSHFVLSLRKCGVDTFFMGDQAVYSNIVWSKACFESERAERIYLVEGGKIKQISQDHADRIFKDFVEHLPEGYMEHHEKAEPSQKAIPVRDWSVDDWKAGMYL